MTEGIAYKELKVRSEAYDIESWEKIDDLYEGGFAFEKKREKYLPRLANEHRDRHRDRLGAAAYINYFGQITDYFTAALFTKEIAVRPAADADNPNTPGEDPEDDLCSRFSKDVDGKGTKLSALLKCLATTALNKRHALICLDLPRRPADGAIRSRLDEERAGLDKVYAYELPLEQVIDWEEDDDGGFRYLVIHRIKKTKAPPGKRTNEIVEEFKVWEKEEPGEPEDSRLFNDPDGDSVDEGARVAWRLYRIAYDPKKAPKDDDIIPLVDEGDVSFRCIPVFKLEVPLGLWVGNKIALLALEHVQGRSALASAENRSLLAIPVVQRGSEFEGPGGSSPSETQQNPHRGNRPQDEFERAGVVSLGAGDKYGFWEPSGACYEIKDRQLKDLKDEMFRVVHQMALSVSNNAKTVARSGESKKEDRVAEAIVLGALGALVRDFAVRIFTEISEAMGEEIVWNAHGLDNYESEDREALLEEATSLDLIPIPSVTFKRYLKQQVAQRLCPNMAPETQEQMRLEIEEGTKAEESMRVEMSETEHETKIDEMKNPPKPVITPGRPMVRA